MKFKYYLRGCGFGILFASIVLMISFHVRGTMDDSAVMERASELGMVMPEDSAELPQQDTQLQQQDSQNAEKPVEPDTTEIQKTTEPDSGQKNERLDTEDKKPKKVSVTVKKGEVCRELAEDLQEKGLVEDAGEFQTFMRENNYDEKISVGTFKLVMGMTYEEIAKKITFSE